MKSKCQWLLTMLALAVLFAPARFLLGQADQGTITGVVQDPSGAVIGNASVTLTNVDEGRILNSKTDGAGVYVFSPVKIGSYRITASAPGFESTTQTNLHLDLQQTLNILISLKPGSATETVTVTTEAPLMQTQESSVGQTVNPEALNSVPLSGRNWVYIAQLAAGADPGEGSRGAGKGDFNANGQRAEQNNFILDGVDNNVNVVDFFNGASFVAQPPPDALAEFKVQTSDYSAEFGHSAGAVVNASLKSGSNTLHGSAWEYIRNTNLDAKDWDAVSVSPYHENQFGITLGLPIIPNKLFLFGDVQANRIVFSETQTLSVPSALERTGNLQELLSPTLTGASAPIQLYHQSADAPPQLFANNDLTSMPGVTPNQSALAVLNLYPKPSGPNASLLYDNSVVNRPATDNTFQWDTRMDWNIGAKDTTYAHYSYWNEMGYRTPPMGNQLDGGAFGDTGTLKDLGQNFMLSETHVFTQTLTNEARIGYNYMHTGFQHPNAADAGFGETLGFGGIPVAPLNGGLPSVAVTGISNFGSPTWSTTSEHENVYQILDNVTKIAGNHALKAGVNFQSIRFSTLQPQNSRGNYNYTGESTSNMNAANTGYGVADFLLDSQNNGGLSNEVVNVDARWYDALYFQDDWRILPALTLNLGLRWDYYQPYQDVGGYQASYNMTGAASLNTSTGIGSGSAQYQIPNGGKSYAEAIFKQTQDAFLNVLAKDNITLTYTSDPHIVKPQFSNFAPRVGISYSPDAKTAIRMGYGIFYGGLESIGYYPNLGENYPFQYSAIFPQLGSCGDATHPYSCPTDGITIANGFASIVSNGFASDVSDLSLRGSDTTAKTPSTQSYNLSVERSVTNNIVATASYVGNTSHHLQVLPDPNNPLALENPNNNPQNARPLPDFGGSEYTSYSGASNYNALQTKLEKRLSAGNSLLATYTWSHVLDDSVTPMNTIGDAGYRQSTLIPISKDYASTAFDTRHRFTFNAFYDLPFGLGRKYLNQSKIANAIVGGWSTNMTFVAQTGNPFTVRPTAISTAAGGTAMAVKIKDPFAAGGTFTSPDPTIQVACASKTRTRNNWYNPCSFENPWNPNDWAYEPSHYIPTGPADPHLAAAQQPVYVTDYPSVVGYLGGKRDDVYGPGYERINMSLFKDFKVYREQTLQFRADIFNLFNTPSLANPAPGIATIGGGGDDTIDSTGGKITAPRFLQNLTPDARFIQVALKYSF